MATEAQNKANKANSLKSSGPKTDQGKRNVSLNAVKDGIFAKASVLPTENADEFSRFACALAGDLKPSGTLERTLADMIVAAAWRLRRLHGVEVGIFEMYSFFEGKERGAATAFAHDASNMGCFERLNRYESGVMNKMMKLLHELQRLQARRAGEQIAPPIAVDVTVAGTEAPPLAVPVIAPTDATEL